MELPPFLKISDSDIAAITYWSHKRTKSLFEALEELEEVEERDMFLEEYGLTESGLSKLIKSHTANTCTSANFCNSDNVCI